MGDVMLTRHHVGDLRTYAENCREASRRLAKTGLPADTIDARVLAIAADYHDAKADELEKATASYWWQDRDR